jgi:c-di-GMP-binding flagellar brake protein YcgR
MTQEDKRTHPRIDALNLIAYTCSDENGQITVQGMGRTLNISEGGILLETHVQIDSQSDILLTIGLEDDLVEVKGKVVTSAPGKEDKFESGIHFKEIGETELTILKLYIIAFKDFKSTA